MSLSQTYGHSDKEQVITKTFSPLSPPPQPPSTLATTTLPPLIYHITAPSGITTPITLQDFLSLHTRLNTRVLTSLTELGCVYVHHTPSPRKSPRAVRKHVSSLSQPVRLGTRLYCRVHAHPKRYTPLYDPFVILDNDGILVVHKPPGIPVCASVDNCVECVTNLIGARVTTRLDVGTSGVLIMGRCKEDVIKGNDIVKQAQKYYIVFCEWRGDGEGVLEKGMWKDWYRSKASLGRGVREAMLKRWEDGEHGAKDGWVDAVLEIVDIWDQGFGDRGVVAVVRLLTGRTHQIRLQFCARGWLVHGDDKYEMMTGKVYDGGVVGGDALRLGLHCWKIRFGDTSFTAELRSRVDLMGMLGEREGDVLEDWLENLWLK